ncbi:MAG: dihydroxyacetone kinase subunit L [Dehalococcoidales bacterium]|nr:dihydroxyacetone kinase subunit L [Dehalococcoidales bacterium]
MLTTTNTVSILKDAASDFESHSEELRQLDAVIGDGDLGVTVELGSKGLREYLSSPEENNVGQLLVKCGLQFNKASPSTFGTLLASAFMSAGKAVMGKEKIEIEDLVLIADGAVDGIKKRGKAEVGDKTMLDCLVPAVEAFKKELASGAEPETALKAAVTAAEEGMKATIPMMSKHGRASWHREKTIGVQDAGATAMYYLIESFARHLISRI